MSCAIVPKPKVPNPGRCYLGAKEIQLLGLSEEYEVEARRRAAAKEDECQKRERVLTHDRKRIA
jgi:hypothetical protein